MAMRRGAAGNENACVQLRDFIQSRLLHGAGGGGDAMLRAGLAAAMLVGIVTGRRIVGGARPTRATVAEAVTVVEG
ncbi:hypothetical protein MUY14_07900 [Amycolatopsis sp. FBCC-B4732]|nr:hypothetical protein MUY14_07900 [Amycolatopsis sp. FBCC-B4732]